MELVSHIAINLLKGWVRQEPDIKNKAQSSFGFFSDKLN